MNAHNASLICLVFALVIFVIGAFGVNSERINLTNAGLAFLAASLLFGAA